MLATIPAPQFLMPSPRPAASLSRTSLLHCAAERGEGLAQHQPPLDEYAWAASPAGTVLASANILRLLDQPPVVSRISPLGGTDARTFCIF